MEAGAVNPEAPWEDLVMRCCAFSGISDRGKAYTDVLAGCLVLLNSFVMLVELEIEGQAVGAVLLGGQGPKLSDVSPVFKTLDAWQFCHRLSFGV